MDAKDFLQLTERALSDDGQLPPAGDAAVQEHTPSVPASTDDQPTSFSDGRYVVKRFLGEGGKKKVYLAHDELLDRDIAFALIKSEGLDDVSRERITREAQAMGRLGSDPPIVTVLDLGKNPSSGPTGHPPLTPAFAAPAIRALGQAIAPPIASRCCSCPAFLLAAARASRRMDL